MKVSELIEELKRMPMDDEVVMEDEIAISCGHPLPKVRSVSVLTSPQQVMLEY